MEPELEPKDLTFMTIHNLTPDANILFASDSVSTILGYQPHEVQNRSCFDYFHPDEVPFARSVHGRGVLLDKAAVLHYARIQKKDGRWVNCECCFSVVHDVLVACTSIYLGDPKSHRRALDAPQIRRIFSSSPRDPRYHMLEHLSPKFKMPAVEREPRAALILNRFTRNLTVLYATNAVSSIMGLTPEELQDRPFYECIQENCLRDAIQCLESAKANESIAYLRFWYRNPRGGDEREEEEEEEERLSSSNSDSDDGGAHLDAAMDVDDEGPAVEIKVESDESMDNGGVGPSTGLSSLTTSGPSTAFASVGNSAYQTPLTSQSTGTAATVAAPRFPSPGRRVARRQPRPPPPTFELEAVVSCTSDGLVVVLRKARPAIPVPRLPAPAPPPFHYENGLFAAPWGLRPIVPHFSPEALYTFRPPLLPQYMPLRENFKAAGGPPVDQLMQAVRQVGVFAWALVGINGRLADYAQGGRPGPSAQPPDGLPVWDPSAGATGYDPPENQPAQRWMAAQQQRDHRGQSLSSAGPSTGPSYGLGNRTYPAALPEPATQGYGHSIHPQGPFDGYSYGGGSSVQQQTTNWPGHPPTSMPFTPAATRPAYNPVRPFQSSPNFARNPVQHSSQEGYLPPPSSLAAATSSSSVYSGLPQEPWAEASTSRPFSPSYPVTTQPSSSDDSSSGYRYHWQ